MSKEGWSVFYGMGFEKESYTELHRLQAKGGRLHLEGTGWEMRHLRGIMANEKWH